MTWAVGQCFTEVKVRNHLPQDGNNQESNWISPYFISRRIGDLMFEGPLAHHLQYKGLVSKFSKWKSDALAYQSTNK